MKELINMDYSDHKIIINGSFGWNEWKGCNCVRLYVDIRNKKGKLIEEYTDVINEEKPFKLLFWEIGKIPSLKQLTKDGIEDNVFYSKSFIDKLIYKQEMTDGLIDSLDTLK